MHFVGVIVALIMLSWCGISCTNPTPPAHDEDISVDAAAATVLLSDCASATVAARTFLTKWPYFCMWLSDDADSEEYTQAECNQWAQTEDGPYNLELIPSSRVLRSFGNLPADKYCGYRVERLWDPGADNDDNILWYTWQNMACERMLNNGGHCYVTEVMPPPEGLR